MLRLAEFGINCNAGNTACPCQLGNCTEADAECVGDRLCVRTTGSCFGEWGCRCSRQRCFEGLQCFQASHNDSFGVCLDAFCDGDVGCPCVNDLCYDDAVCQSFENGTSVCVAPVLDTSCEIHTITPTDYHVFFILGCLLFCALLRLLQRLVCRRSTEMIDLGDNLDGTALDTKQFAATDADQTDSPDDHMMSAHVYGEMKSARQDHPDDFMLHRMASKEAIYSNSGLASSRKEYFPVSEINAVAIEEQYSTLPSPPPVSDRSLVSQEENSNSVHRHNGIYGPVLADTQYHALSGRSMRKRTKSKAGKMASIGQFCTRRFPYMDRAKVFDVFLAVCYVLTHVGYFTIWHDDCLSVATTVGYIAIANAFFVMLPGTRNSLLGWLFGVSFDETVLFHRWLGYWTIFTVFLHGCLYIEGWVNDPASFDRKLALSKFHFALGSAGACLVILVTSFSYCRRNRFELFYWLHYCFLAFYVLGGLHSVIMMRYAVIALGLYVCDRLIRLFWGAWPRKAIKMTAKTANCLSVEFHKARFANYACGNYVFLNFPAVSLLEWHPYTLSSSPFDDTNEVHIKALGDHTIKLYTFATTAGFAGQRPRVRVDGPYGKFSLNWKRYPVVVLIGGGVGVTPIIATLKTIYRIRMSAAARTKHPRAYTTKKVYLVWSCATLDDYSWFSDVINDCVNRVNQDKSYPELNLYIHITKMGEGQLPEGYHDFFTGRADVHKILGIVSAEQHDILRETRGCVIACGPTPLVNASWDACLKCGPRYGTFFAFHHETFDF